MSKDQDQIIIDTYQHQFKNGNITYFARLEHRGLDLYKELSARNSYELEEKIEAQKERWENKWQKELEARRKLKSAETAKRKTEIAQQNLAKIEDILIEALNQDYSLDWESFKDKEKFSMSPPSPPSLKKTPNKPSIYDEKYKPKYQVLDYLIPPFKRKKNEKAEKYLRAALMVWREETDKIEMQNRELKEKFNSACDKWEEERKKYYKEQEIFDAEIDTLKINYSNHEPEAIEEYCSLILNRSTYPIPFDKQFDVQYIQANEILLVDYTLPNKETIPSLTDVKYISSRDEIKESFLSENQHNTLYDKVLYSMVLRSLFELFSADIIEAIKAINFNGWIDALNLATGNQEQKCILSVNSNKDEFLTIDLSRVDTKACFKGLKGVGSSKLHDLAPIEPIMQINRTDRRFIQHYDVSHTLNSGTNLAAMDWEDFEHLVREVFEKEFSSQGGEVKVTQSSKDGGVDAIAFDPDPIRGGKIVIQAKRYTNTVGVSAVRDLYGTVMNEGANKGILVTTSDYGADAYTFAKDKPLSLLNGSNLLYLLEKHGKKARIDLIEAKKLR